MLTSLLLSLASVSAQAPLEPQQETGILFGSWYDRLHGDTPQKTEERVNHKPFSLWQSDVNISRDGLQNDFVFNFTDQVDAINTNAILYLTVYPYDGYEYVTDEYIMDLANHVKNITDRGRRMMIRYASEMNGNWFVYGQQPTAFLESWRKVVDTVRSVATKRDMYAFVWAPNSGNGYPFPTSPDGIELRYPETDFTLLDTNGDGAINGEDDPYSPYYPGDDYVDWVGFSVYDYGPQWPWVENNIPSSTKVEDILTGSNGWGQFNFYEMFSSPSGSEKTAGGKPFMITESAATVHLWVEPNAPPAFSPEAIRPALTDSESRVAIKQSWWRQFINPEFMAKYPKFRAAMFFEFIKFEETTWRDFTSLGKGTDLNSPFGNDGGDMDGPVLEAFRADMQSSLGDLIIWGEKRPWTTAKPDDSINGAVGKQISLIGALFAAALFL